MGQVQGDTFRVVMRQVATAVTLVTAAKEGQPYGMVVGSFTSVSVEPPLISLNVRCVSAMHEVLTRQARFAVHLLGQDQATLAQRFATPYRAGWKPFEGIAYQMSADGVALIAKTPSILCCTLYAVHGAGDHSIVVGEVTDTMICANPTPLLYYAHGYHSLGASVLDAVPAS
jgi:flavin reductase (DIM6/NTAB) family NADH-FMN oxidoreductase RutF